MPENMASMKTVRPMTKEITGDRINTQNKELQNLYSSPNTRPLFYLTNIVRQFVEPFYACWRSVLRAKLIRQASQQEVPFVTKNYPTLLG
jgi:hypothetical protein